MIHLDVHIMGQSYRLACRDGEQRTLREAVSYLDGKMCQLRDSGKVKGTDRIAVMAALSVAAVGHVDPRGQAKTRVDAHGAGSRPG
jgi:cell division protein ZapA